MRSRRPLRHIRFPTGFRPGCGFFPPFFDNFFLEFLTADHPTIANKTPTVLSC